MSKIFKYSLISVTTLFIILLVTLTTKVKAADEESVLSSIITSENYNEEIADIIKDSFPKFSISPNDFNERVINNSFKVLEITPRIYRDETTEISEIKQSFSRLNKFIKI